MKVLLMLLLCCMPLTSFCSTEGRENTAAALLLLVDYIQTRNMAYDHDYRGELVYHENNPLLGEQPTKQDVDKYFLISAALYVVLQKTLPDNMATIHRRFTIALEGTCVVNNVYIVYSVHN